jgi:site-specific recombinase XerD
MPDAKWDHVLDRFAAALQADEKAALTIRNYCRELRAYGQWYHSVYGEAPDLAAMTAEEFREYKEHLRGRKLKPQSVNLAIASLRSLVKWGCEARLLTEAVKTPKAVRQAMKVPRWLTKPQEKRLLKAVRKEGNPHHLGLVELLLVFALRISEAAALEWGDVTMRRSAAVLRIRKGKGNKEGELPFLKNERAREALLLLGYKQWHKDKDRRLLQGQRGPLSASGVKQLLTVYGKRADIEPFSAHVLRHTCGRRMFEAKVPIQVISRWLRHESLNTTLLYTLPSQEDLQEAAGGSAAGWDVDGDDDD